jgi:transmembrane sensor
LHKKVSDEAIDWIVLLTSGRATAADRAAYDAWLAADPSHEAAVKEAEATLTAVGATRAARSHGAAMDRSWRPGRRALLAGGLAAAGALAIFGTGALGPLAGLYADHSTGVGERRRIVLADGSVVELNTASAIFVDYSPQRRNVSLATGEAVFQVAKDGTRPFVVAADAGEIEALGTVFNVRRERSETDVTVSEGTVAVRCLGARDIRLTAGQHASYGPNGVAGPAAADADTAMAWQRGKLIFNRRPLGEVVAELRRYRIKPIVIANDELRTLLITGVFDLTDSDLLLREITRMTPARLVEVPLLTVMR